MKVCQICQKEYSIKGIGTHIWRNHGSGQNHDTSKFIDYEKLGKKVSKTWASRKKQVEKICPKCSSKFQVTILDGGIDKSRTFCSYKCSNSKSRSLQTRLKISNSLQGRLYKRKERPYCRFCHKICDNLYQIYCSKDCQNKDPERKIRMGNIVKERIKRNGPSGGWPTRLKLDPSYPEKITITILDQLKIEYIREKKVGKYFVDFMIGNVALEIDGGQHKRFIDRQEKDKLKDQFLKSLGYVVYRIDWVDNKGVNKGVFRKSIDEFVKFNASVGQRKSPSP